MSVSRTVADFTKIHTVIISRQYMGKRGQVHFSYPFILGFTRRFIRIVSSSFFNESEFDRILLHLHLK